MVSLFRKKNKDKGSQQDYGDYKKVLSFINQKGGVGKTTMAFNMAHALKNKGAKVLCLDLDPQANLSFLFGVDTDSEYLHIHHLLINSIRELRPLHVSILPGETIRHINGIDLIPAGQELSGLELTVAGINTPRQLILKKFIQKNGFLDEYDYILIDGPPTLGLIVVNIVCASHGILVPFRPDSFSEKGLGHLYGVLEDVEDMELGKGPDILAHIPNLVDGRRKQEELDLAKIEAAYSDGQTVDPFFDKALFVKCQAMKKSVFDFKAKDFIGPQKQFSHIAGIVKEWQDEA